MKTISILAGSLLWLAAQPGAVRAQEGEKWVPCSYCKDKGRKPCRKHGRRDLQLEGDGVTLFCSRAASCPTCEGALAVDCDHCTNGPIERKLEKKREKTRKWLAERRKRIDELIGHPVLQGASKNMNLVWDLKPMTVGKVRMSSHEMLHLYLKRLEDLRKSFEETLQIRSSEIPEPCEIYVWRDGRDQSLASRKYAGMSSRGTGVKFMGSKSVYTMHYRKRDLRSDQDLHRNIVHNTTHLLMANLLPSKWIGQLKGGWADEGLAHYFEFKLDGKCSTYCFQEVGININFKGGKWLVPVRKMVASGRHPSFAAISRKNTDQLAGKEHALSFSYIHFLLEGDFTTKKDHGKRFTRLIRILKKKQPAREALVKVYGWNPLSFEEKWKEWVLRTYPAR